jgi:hypothetical protein
MSTLAITSHNWSRRDPDLACRLMDNATRTLYDANTIAVIGALLRAQTSTRPTTKKNDLIVRTEETSLTTRQLVVPRGAEDRRS